MSRINLIVIGLLSLTLAACASMNKDECKLANWKTIGYEDGSNGHTQAQIGKHRSACAKHGVAPDFAAYQKGHSHGTSAFCNPSRGFSLGSNGRHYRGMCPKDVEPAFLKAYRTGKKVYIARQKVKALQNKQSAQKNELKTVRVQLNNKESLLISPQGNIAQRTALLLEIKELNQRSRELNAQIKQSDKELVVAKAKLNHISSTIHY